MKNSIAFCVLIVAAAACAPARSQDAQGDFRDNPYDSGSSTGDVRADHPFDRDGMTKPYQAYGKRFRGPYDLNPYDGEAPRDNDGRDVDGGGADPYGLSNPDDPDARSRPDRGSVGAYGRPSDASRRAAADLLKHYDQFGHYNDGLTTYPYNPCAVVTPYERDGGPCGGGAPADSFAGADNPYGDRSVGNPYAPGAPGSYGQSGYYRGAASNPYDPYAPPRGDRLPETPYAPGATGTNGQYGSAGATATNPDGPYEPPRGDRSLENPYTPGASGNNAPVAPSAAAAAVIPAGQAAPGGDGSDVSLKADLDSLNRQLDRAEADLRAATDPRPPDQMGGDNRAPSAASGTRDRPNSKPRNGISHGGRAASKPKTPDQFGVYNGVSNSRPATDPVAQGVHSSGSGGLGKRPGATDSGSGANQANP